MESITLEENARAPARGARTKPGANVASLDTEVNSPGWNAAWIRCALAETKGVDEALGARDVNSLKQRKVAAALKTGPSEAKSKAVPCATNALCPLPVRYGMIDLSALEFE